ncbi:DNA translocase FtsK [Clostridiaceae bacterium]|nr:DNA translocase FtsK [Clostridiaceae bacterium]RKI11110.1 DNA translocase FtsK [bacterium 1XD21-70]
MAATTNKNAASKRGGKAENAKSRGSAACRAKGSGKAAASRGAKRTRAAQVPEQEDFIGAEVLVILSFAVAVLLFLSNFHLCGAAGGYLRGFQLGIFGMVGFIAPLLLFVGTCFYFSNRGNPAAMRKMLASVALVFALCGLIQLLFGKKPEDGAGLMGYYHMSSVSGAGGGLAGGLICAGLTAILGNIGAFLVLIVCLAISVVCITERSLVNAVKKQGDAAYRFAREDMGRRRELHAGRREQQRLEKEQRIRGVDLAVTDFLAQEGSAGEGIYEAPAEEPEGMEEDTAGAAQGGRKENVSDTEPATDPADVFTGKITMPGSPAGEDMVPFEADEVLSTAESAQRLVEEGISRLSDYEGVFGRPAKAPSFQGPASEPSFHGLSEAFTEPAAGQKGKKTDLPEPEGGNGSLPEEEGWGQQEDSSYGLKPLRLAPAASRYEEEADEIFMEEPVLLGEAGEDLQDLHRQVPSQPEDAPVALYRADPHGYADLEEQGFPAGGEWEESLPEEAWEEEEPAGQAGAGLEDFVVLQEEKRVVTASGKVIESDTEALHKKLEAKRKEALEAREAGEASVQQQIRAKQEEPKREYVFPSVTLLKRGNPLSSASSRQEYKDTAVKLQQTLRDFGVGVTVTNISCGPSVTRYELHPEQGVKVSKIVGLADDIKLSLAAADIRIEAPIPGKSAVGIEVPNKENTTVYLRELLESEAFKGHPSRMAFAVGKDIGGQVVVTDIAKMPHLLIAGATGSGKSVCINTLIMSILFKSSPEDVKLIMVDPKVVELSVYNGIPHLLIPVVTDPKKASGALNWAVAEMQDRYKKFAECNVRNLSGYNARIDRLGDVPEQERPKKMPQIVIIVDELADLMMVAPGEVEDAICRLAQLARAAGIHLVIATQRPSVNVITGLIKANVPSRIAFSVSSGVDSRTIIDMYGAEKLLGKGDMLFFPSGIPKPQRVQGAFVSDSEVQKVVEFLTGQGLDAGYDPDVEKQMNAAPAAGPAGGSGGGNGRDEYFEQAGRFIIEKDKASIGMLQRMFKIGFNRAARIMDQLADAGVVGDEEGTKPRKILVTMEEFEELLSGKD